MIEIKTKGPIIYRGDLSKLESFIADDGYEYFCSADGEHFYNAKGEKVGGFFKKVGGGIVKGAKGVGKAAAAVGRVIKKMSLAVVKATKTVATGVKKIGGNRKKGATKLIHHKKKAPAGAKQAGQKFSSKNTPAPDLSKGPLAGLKDIGKGILGKGGKAPQSAPGMPAGLAGLGLSPAQAAMYGKSGKSPIVNPDGTVDVFSLPLKKLTPIETKSLKPEEIVQVNGQSYSTKGIEPGKDVVIATDEETGQEIVTVQYEPDEVVAVTGKDGNVEYVKKDDAGMSKALKYTLIIGGSVIVLSVIGYIIYKVSKKK